MEISSVGKVDEKMANEGAAAQALPKEASQAVAALGQGADKSMCADMLIQQCGSPDKAVQQLKKIEASPDVPSEVRDAASDLIHQIKDGDKPSDMGKTQDSASLQGMAAVSPTESKDRDAVAGAAGVRPVAPVDQMKPTDFSTASIHPSERKNSVV